MAGSWFPQMTAFIEMPEMLDPSGPALSRVNRVHNAAVKDSLKFALIRHQVEQMPKHFEISARSRYGYKPRSIRTQRRKLKLGLPDLVRTGATREMILRRKPYDVRTGGTAYDGNVRATMVFRFRERIRMSDNRTGVTVSQMASELSKVLPDEAAEGARHFGQQYAKEIDSRIKSKRVRRRLSARFAQLGLNP